MTRSTATADEISRPVCLPDELSAVVAVPIRNERQRVAACLQALAAQAGLAPGSFGILLFLNNCTDDTACVVSETIASLPDGLFQPLRVIEVSDVVACAGWARRQAMDAAALWLAESGSADGMVLTTDADSRVEPDWVARSLAIVAAGADAVAGRIALDPQEAALLPTSLHDRGRLEARYEELLTEIGARLDPEPGNPWPCHWTRSGASLAVRRRAYETVGGMPPLPAGEDRAFVEALRQANFVVRQDPGIVVTTSGRLEGRAVGGAADTMRLRCERPDSLCDDRLERLDRALRRVLWRRWLRRAYADDRLHAGRLWPSVLGLPSATAAAAAILPSFSHAHAAIEAASPQLAYRPLPPSRLPRQIRLAEFLLKALRRFRAGDRGGSAPFGIVPGPARREPPQR